MKAKQKLHPFVESLISLRFSNAFNPYSDCCAVFDKPNASVMRSSILSEILYKASRSEVDAIWVGRDLGYRGGRRTGLALTDDIHIESHLSRWGISSDRPTRGDVVSERTAAVIWNILNRIADNVFLWNVFPFHPHEDGHDFTNRKHNLVERRAGEEILSELISVIRPKRIVAVGNDAAQAIGRVAVHLELSCVRHPSYGGQTQFLSQVKGLYGIYDEPDQQAFML